MQNSITFMGPFIVQNSQQTARRGRDAHPPPPPPFRRYSQVFGHFLEGKRPGKCQTWPQYNEDLWTCLGLFEPLPATSLCTANCSYYYVLLCILQHGLLDIWTELLSIFFSWSAHMRRELGTKLHPGGVICRTMIFYKQKKFKSRSI